MCDMQLDTFKREIIYYFFLFLSSVKLYRWFVANVMNWFRVYRYTYKDFFSSVGAEGDSFLSDMLFSSSLFDVHFQGLFFFFFCRRGVTSLSSVSTRQTSYSHSKLTHLQPENILRPLCCVSVFVLIKILVLTCNKRKIILYFVGCSEFLITIFCFSLHVLQFKHFFAPSHFSISP